MNSPLCLCSSYAHEGTEPLALPGKFSRPLRRADALTLNSVASVFYCLEALSQKGVELDLEQCAIVAGFGLGTIETNLAFVDSLFEQDGSAGSPTLFSHSVHNTVAGYVSRLFGIHGPAFTLTAFEWPFLTALSQACCFIQAGIAETALVIGCEVESKFMQAVHARFLGSSGEKGEEWVTGAMCWLVADHAAFASKKQVPLITLDGPELTLHACKPEELLLRLSESYPGKIEKGRGAPFGYALSLAGAVSEVIGGRKEKLSWQARAEFGSARLTLSSSPYA